ncbi:uncharacterized protein BX664DRAFT_254336 [Halteromyces radiatus]|uniref:uncharacterized protein n=1 Tax=Halteromyces radiatus TaxID=101107 RepID=UPI0022208501|nr:uncharacterized protein BX664DRAFT_254336 [Halteromyces radiatus]KAI8099152.1 hypothetical protein BX664DRAFT_254336 [Halteromyces radiatus]
MEQDDGPVKQMVLMVADIVRTGSSRDKYRLQLTDGWYQISAYVDSRMNHMIEQGKIYIGLKISITGAQLTGDRTARTPLEALSTEEDNMNENDLHDITTTAISISSNSCLPCSWDTRLGYPYRRRRRQVIRRLDSIYDDGGLITMMDVVVCRKYPMMYSETLVNGLVITRNSKDEEDYRRTLEQQQQRQRTSPSLSSSPYSDTCQDRRQVSGYFKLRLCDIDYNNNSSNNIIATLLVSKATEVMHMDLMEGQCYRLYFVQPYQPKMRSFEGPYLITTRLTKWEHLSPKISLSVGNKHNIIEYPLRSICPCAHVKDLTKTDVDMVVYVLRKSERDILLLFFFFKKKKRSWYSSTIYYRYTTSDQSTTS